MRFRRSREVTSDADQTGHLIHADPAVYIQRHFIGGGVTPYDQWKMFAKLKRENHKRLQRSLDSQGQATAYRVLAADDIPHLYEAIERCKSNQVLEAWSGDALPHLLADSEAGQKRDPKIVELTLRRPSPSGTGRLSWDATMDTVSVNAVYEMTDADILLQRHEVERQAIRLTGLGSTALGAV